MIQKFVNSWEMNKDKLRAEIIKNGVSIEYKDLVEMIIKNVLNHDDEEYVMSSVIDDGNDQGTQLFFFFEEGYQPDVSDYYFTSNYYGSCSGCDSLQGILMMDYDVITEDMADELMTLCLHLLQSMKKLVD